MDRIYVIITMHTCIPYFSMPFLLVTTMEIAFYHNNKVAIWSSPFTGLNNVTAMNDISVKSDVYGFTDLFRASARSNFADAGKR